MFQNKGPLCIVTVLINIAALAVLCRMLLRDQIGTVPGGNVIRPPRDYYICCAAFPSTDRVLAMVIPYSDISRVSRSLTFEMILVMIVLSGIAYALAMYLANHILRRVKQLADTMQDVENGNTNVLFPCSSQDEIGQLILHFNRMMDHIQQLMDEKVQYGLALKDLELKALLAQINPHFLYNTLDIINCLAIQKNTPEIADVVLSLSTFYKISLSKGKEYISLGDEITHARMYLKILNIRFDHRITDTWRIASEMEDLKILKLILQPIIENAAIHGIFEREDGCGSILVTGWQEGSDFYLSVADDGIGMTPEVVATNFLVAHGEIADASGGYGIRNIRSRLLIAYGPEYGLSCVSRPGKGTVITVHFSAAQPPS